MAGTAKKWLIGCGVGCGVTILLNIFIFVGGGFLLTQPMNKAVKSQKKLTEAFGLPGDFIPEVDGISPERLEVFLAVRQELMPSCDEFRKIAQGFKAMDKIENEENPSAGEIIKGLGKIMGSVKGLVAEMGRVTELRNEFLLDQGMGMGEYTWIYVLAYNSWLGYSPNTGVEDTEGGIFSPREIDLITDLLQAHAGALRAAGRFEEADIWEKESEKTAWDDSRVPFASGEIPAEITSVLESYRSALEAVYCPEMGDFDLGEIKKSGLSFHSN